MPRRGFTTITVPSYIENRISKIADKYDLNSNAQAIYLLIRLYEKLIMDPETSKITAAKIEKILKTIEKDWKKIIQKSKEG